MRASGILMPIFSLASPYGIGTFGKAAYEFVDFLKEAGQSYWQILPLGPTGFGDSPYQSFSSFAGNPYFIDLDTLKEWGYLHSGEYEHIDYGTPNFVDYGKLYNNRLPILNLAASRFLENTTNDYSGFCSANEFWLEDFALFMALKNDGIYLNNMPKSLLVRKKDALLEAKEKYSKEIEIIKAIQYFFFKQWKKLKEYANKNGIKIIGDIPIYVSPDSADLWANPEQFLLDTEGKPTAVAGCPPDAFSEDGQLWGNPLYNWDKMKSDGYAWWQSRIAHSASLYDVVRIDHFRAFDEYYAIPFGDENAKKGKWEKGPGMSLINAINQVEGIEIIAEDLGHLTDSVEELLKKSGYPGMAVLQFAFDPKADSKYLPHNIGKNCVVYVGTHDNDTVNGWINAITSAEFEFCTAYLRLNTNEGYNWGMIKAALATAADTCIIQMQDLLGLGSEGRINTPSVSEGNWQWRIAAGCVNSWLAGILKEQTKLYRRTK